MREQSNQHAARLRVLAVDESDESAERLCTILQAFDDTVIEAECTDSLDEALAWLDAQSRAPDVVLLSLAQPDRKGVEAAYTLRVHAGAPIVVIAGNNARQAAEHALEYGLDDCVSIDASTAELMHAVRRAGVRHQQEADLRLARAVFDRTGQGIAILDAAGFVERANAATCRLLGYAAEELIGRFPTFVCDTPPSDQAIADVVSKLDQHDCWQGEIRLKRKSGDPFVAHATLCAVRDQKGYLYNHVVLLADHTRQHRYQRMLEHAAYYDALTSLPNRALLADRIAQTAAHCRRTGSGLAVAHIQLLNCREINDTYGMEAGDRVIETVAERIRRTVRSSDTVSRIEGDAFVAVLPEVTEAHDTHKRLLQLLDLIREPVQVGMGSPEVSACIGVCQIASEGNEAINRWLEAAVANARRAAEAEEAIIYSAC